MKRTLFVVFLVALLVSCKLTREPERGTTATWIPSDGQISVALNFGVDLKDIEARLNQLVPNKLHQINDNVSKCVAKTKVLQFHGLKTSFKDTCVASVSVHAEGPVERNGPIRVHGSANTFDIFIPIKAHAKLTPRGDVGRATGLRETAETALTVQVHGKASIKPDWTPDIVLSGDFKWDKRPQIDVLGIPITFGSKAEKPLRKLIDDQLANLQKQVPQELVRDAVQKQWEAAFSPIQISQTPAAWALVAPDHLEFSGIDIKSGRLTAAVAVKGTGKVVVGAMPKAAQVPPLPKLKTDPSIAQDSLLKAPVIVEYAAIANEISTALKGTVFQIKDESLSPDFKGASFEVLGIDVFPSGDKLALEVKISINVPGQLFDTNGSIFAVAKPVVDPSHHVARLDDLDITPVTNNVLIDASSIPILKTGILQAVSPSLQYDYSKEYDEFVSRLNGALNAPPQEGVLLTTELAHADIENAFVAKEGLILVASAQFRSEISATPVK